jgi:hypothetical protein
MRFVRDRGTEREGERERERERERKREREKEKMSYHSSLSQYDTTVSTSES